MCSMFIHAETVRKLEHVPVVKADMPEPVIKGGFASPDTIAHIAVQKFVMASPLYRQEKEWRQSGIWLCADHV